MKTAFFFCFEVYYYIDYIAVQTLVHNVWKSSKKSHIAINLLTQLQGVKMGASNTLTQLQGVKMGASNTLTQLQGVKMEASNILTQL